MSSTYAEKVIPCWSNTLRGMSKTTTNRKQERGQPCLTRCVVLKTTSSAPRRNVDPRSITREFMRSSRSGVPSLSRSSRIRSFGGAVEGVVEVEGQNGLCRSHFLQVV